MRELFFVAPGEFRWREVPDPVLDSPGAALVRPLAVACCDLDVAVAAGLAPLPPGYAQGHEGVAEVLEVAPDVTQVRPGDRVIVPFQLNCGTCGVCRRGVTGSCATLPLMSMYGLGSLAGRDGGGFLADVVLVPFADAMLVPLPPGTDPVAFASLSDNISDGWRTVGPYADELAALDPSERRVLVLGAFSIGLYAVATAVALGARVDYVDTDPDRLAIAARLGASAHERPLPDRAWDRYPVTVSTSANPKSLVAAAGATWPDGVCTDTGIYYQDKVELPLLRWYTQGIRFVTSRVNARAAIPRALQLLAGADLGAVVQSTVDWDDAPDAWARMRAKTVITR